MLIIIFGILALVFASKYKKYPLLKTGTTAKVLSIILAVLVGIETFSILGYVALMATGSFFSSIEQSVQAVLYGMDLGLEYLTGIFGDISEFISTVIWISLIIESSVYVFGIIALVKSFSTINNAHLKAQAEANSGAMNVGYQQPYNYYQQAPSYTENTQSYSTNTAPAPEASQPQNWFCTSCGASNIAMANFCGSCGNKRQ